MFYAPRQIWKRFEGGRLKFCAHAMSEPELDEVKRVERVEKLLKCYRKFKSKGYGYAYKFLGLELFNLFNAAAQMVLLNKLMGGRWIDYGLRLWDHYSFEGEQLYQVQVQAHPGLNFFIWVDAMPPDKFQSYAVSNLFVNFEKIREIVCPLMI